MNKLSETEERLQQLIAAKYSELALVIDAQKSSFEEALNKQRINYERKLINMENLLKKSETALIELKKSPLKRFIEKFRKKK